MKKTTLVLASMALALLLACGVVMNEAAGPAEAAFPEKNGKIAFVSTRDGNEEIYAMDEDGTNETRLTTEDGRDVHPRFSPDGKRLTFPRRLLLSDGVVDETIYLMDPFDVDPEDGSGDHLIKLNPGTSPNFMSTYSPDGRKMAFVRQEGGDNEIWVMDADGMNPIQLTDNTSIHDARPVFSPDGTKIAYTRRDTSSREPSLRRLDVYVMNADGTGTPTRLTNSPGNDSNPRFSPDGKTVAFDSDRIVGSNSLGSADIYVMKPDGTEQTPLAPAPNSTEEYPVYSPDGNQLIFSGTRDGDEEIYVMASDGSGIPTRLTDNDTADTEPDWGPLPDTTPPLAPTIDLQVTSDSGNSDTDNITNDNTPTFIGMAEAGSLVKVYAGQTLLGSITAKATGDWDYTVGSVGSEPGIATLSDDIYSSIRATATDAAGNTSPLSTALSPELKIDTVNPSVEVSGFEDGYILYKGDPNAALPTPGCSIQDPAPSSGLYSQSSSPDLKSGTGLNAEGVGSATYICSAEDNAGNLGSDDESYSVQYARNGGVLQPINPDNSSVFSRGRTVPVKFQLGFDQPNGFGTGPWTLQRIQVSCENLSEELVSESVPSNTPSEEFRYDSTSDQYIYNANFRDEMAGTCWYLSVNVKDGSTPLKSAYFEIQK